jgi:hypothetical protein
MRAVKDSLAAPLDGEVGKNEKDGMGGLLASCARATRTLGRSMRGQARRSPVLVQRAVSEDPRWTRAVGDHLARPQGGR